MKIVDKIAEKAAEKNPFYSFEYFPPKTSQGLSNLYDRIGRMQSLSPTFVTCTWGAGGSTFEKTTELSAVAQTVHGLETCMHLTCTNMDRGKVDDALAEAKRAGIQNILALRGDPPRGQEYWTQVDDTFVHAIDLVRYIRQQYGDYFCIGVAGYPEGHMDSTETDSSVEIQYLKEKIDAGADFVLTQLFYDVDGFLAWEKQWNFVSHHPGIMPIQSFNGFRRITKLAKIRVPTTVAESLEPIKNDDQKVKDYGVTLAADTIQRLLDAGITGFHICTLNLEKSVRLILERVGFVNPATTRRQQQHHQIINEPVHKDGRRDSVDGTLNPVIWNPTDDHLGRSESWDDFPNGRWGDARSPAFGDLDGYGASLKVKPWKALELWGRPKNVEDISQLFVKFIQGTIPLLPWSEGAPLPETEAIQARLVTCNQRGFLTVGSQPAVDGKPSTDPLVGWGPKGGYVYQKAFIELFVGPNEVVALVEKLRTSSPWITFLAASRDGDVVTNLTGDVLEEQNKIAELKKICGKKQDKVKKDAVASPSSSSSSSSTTTEEAPACETFSNKLEDELVEDSNAVTWGVFPGKEIIQPTVIEKVSFLAWRDEAFEIWREWEHLYPKGSESRKLLHQIGHDYWLFNIVNNDFRDPDGLWDIVA
ncbi:MAG: methylenetetrahydrofolate reductase 1 [Podila humilis]|nr:MAG: methylenetetrahydrofolate reductase 1 [Podila humilis]